MTRATIFPLLLIGMVGVWAAEDMAFPLTWYPTWVHLLGNTVLFLCLATHIWRGRAWR